MNRWAVDSGTKAESEAPVEADESGAERGRLQDGALELAYILRKYPLPRRFEAQSEISLIM